MLRRVRRVPAPLAVLLLLAAAECLAWGIAIPPLQGPDEAGHFAYVQRIAERGEIPFKPRRGGGSRSLQFGSSSELFNAGIQSGAEPLRGNLEARPAWASADEAIWRARAARLPADARSNGGFNVSFRNPPLFYVLDAVPYLAASGGSFFTRLAVMRAFNVVLIVALVALAWTLAGELLGTALAPRTLACALVALQPGLTNLAGVVNPDLLLCVLWTAGLLGCVRLVRRGWDARRVAVLVAILVAACLTNGRGIPLAVPILVAVLFAVSRRKALGRRSTALGSVIVGVVLLAGVALITWRPVEVPFQHPNPGQFLSYVWQFYFPALPGMDALGPSGYGVRQAFVERLWGGYAQLEVGLPACAVTGLAVASVVALVGVAAALVLRRASLDPGIVMVGLVGVLAVVVGLHLTAYRSLVSGDDDPIITGRYLLPLLPLASSGLAFAVGTLPRRVAPVVAGALLGVAVVLQLNGLALVTERFWT